MFRNFTVLTVVVALLTLVAAPTAFAGQALDTTAQATPTKAVAADSSLVDQLLGFVVGIFKAAWDGDANNATGTRQPGDIGAGFDPAS